MMGSKAGTKIAEGTLAKVWGILYETRTVIGWESSHTNLYYLDTMWRDTNFIHPFDIS